MAETIKYPLTELGHVAKDFISHHIMTYVGLGDAVTKATGVVIKKASFLEARRSERGFPALRQTVMDYMREQDPELVAASLAVYDQLYRRKGA
ncbi:MAG: hypothetical protein LBR76_00065 [Oscillospiraceae bacterium]|jgi:3-deoxy-D-manno-octulosonate 8-phosphate phosphatase KdsC-like HAD superfamily phosphatase|nr:hypothetical protein [Oscillospiraceae bacterium]